MQFKKHQMMPGIKKMMQNQEISSELCDLLDVAKQSTDKIVSLIAIHMDRLRRLQQHGTSDEENVLRGISEFAYLGFITQRINNIHRVLNEMGNCEQNMLMSECVQDYINREILRNGPTLDDLKKKMKDIEKDLGMTPEEITKEIEKDFKRNK